MPMAGLDPTDIRSLRGDRTRAAFAELLGVNAHSVYRWELPATAAHARRPRGQILATMADRAVFHADPPELEASQQFWAIVEAERRSLAAGKSRWQRFRAAVSLRSFTRQMKTELPRTKR